MRKHFLVWAMYFFCLTIPAGAESFRALVEGTVELSAERPEGASFVINYSGSVLIKLGGGERFFRGVEMQLSAPQTWLSYQGSLAMMIYSELDHVPAEGVHDFEGSRIAFEPLPGKIKIVYQLPVRASHGLKASPYAAILTAAAPASFPVLFRLMPIIKGLSDEIENMEFELVVKPILGDEGAIKMLPRYPEQLKGRPFTVLIDDVVVENINEELLLKEGEHHLAVLSEDYRNESRRFLVEKAKKIDLVIDLQDPTPLIVFEGPENAHFFLDGGEVIRENGPILTEPGVHEVQFQVGDYTLTRTVNVQRGKTYRIALAVDIDIDESE